MLCIFSEPMALKYRFYILAIDCIQLLDYLIEIFL